MFKGPAVVVDGDPTNRRMVTDLLAAEGFAVSDFSCADEASAWAVGLIEPPCLAVIDLGMPGMTGISLATWLVEKFPQIKVLLTASGAPSGVRSRDPQGDGICVLAQPLDPGVVMEKIRELLAAYDSFQFTRRRR